MINHLLRKKWSFLKMISYNISCADEIQSKIFQLNDWNLMAYPALIGIAFNIKMINSFSFYKNSKSSISNNQNYKKKENKSPKKNSKKYIFRLNHHTDYNKSCQELAINKKKQETMWNKYEIEDISTLYYIHKIQKVNSLNKSNNLKLENDNICDITLFNKLFSSIDYHIKSK